MKDHQLNRLNSSIMKRRRGKTVREWILRPNGFHYAISTVSSDSVMASMIENPPEENRENEIAELPKQYSNVNNKEKRRQSLEKVQSSLESVEELVNNLPEYADFPEKSNTSSTSSGDTNPSSMESTITSQLTQIEASLQEEVTSTDLPRLLAQILRSLRRSSPQKCTIHEEIRKAQ